MLCRLPCNAFLYNAFFTSIQKSQRKETLKKIGRKTKLPTSRSIETWMTTTTAKRGKGKSGYDATRDAENTRLQQDAARGKGAWDCEKYEEIRPEDEAKVFEEIATANEGDFFV